MAAAVQAKTYDTPAEKVEAYIKLRDYKKRAKEEFEKSLERVNQAMAKLEGELLQHLNDAGVDSISARGIGTFYRSVQYSATVHDRDKFMDFVQTQECWEALDVRANKTVIKNLLETLPEVPGVKVSTIATVNVRRS